MKRLLSFAAVLAPLAFAGAARADAFPHFDGGWYMPVGFNLGGAFGGDRSGGVVGGVEASVVHLDADLNWVGAYADVVHDGGISRTRVTVGPEIGVACFGLDGGIAVQTGGAKTYVGWVLRPMFTLGIITFYGRFGDLPAEPETKEWGEVGLLFKLPITLDVEPKRYPNHEVHEAPVPAGPKPPPPPPNAPDQPVDGDAPPPITPIAPPSPTTTP